MPTVEYNKLLKQLDTFILKYYLNECKKGSLVFITIFLLSSLLIIVVEYYFHLSSTLRTLIFYIMLIFYTMILVKYLFIPLASLLKIRKGLTYIDAAEIISNHFTQIKDSLRNTIELAEIKTNRYSTQLLLASIDKRISEIKNLPFHAAIDINKTYKVLKFFAIGMAIFIAILLYKPVIIKEGSDRIINYNKEFIPPAPFKFVLLNNNLKVPQGADIEIKLKIDGKYVPQKVYINIGSAQILLTQIDKSTFSYTIKGVNRSTNFFFEADGYTSEKYFLEMIFLPSILNFKVHITPPAYTGIAPSIVENTGDITAPAGSIVSWDFQAIHTDSILLTFNDSLFFKADKKDKEFKFTKKFLHSVKYSILPLNKLSNISKPIVYELNIIPDMFPSIQADFVTDSSMWGMYYFKGTISDDYGFKKLNFVLKYSKDSIKEIKIPIQPNILNQEFYFTYDFSSLKNYSGTIEYYFEIWDNDAINGSKSAKTEIKTFKIPDKKELEKYRNETTQSVLNQLNQTEKIANNLQNEIQKLQKNIINSQSITWEQTQKYQQLIQQYNQLEKMLNKINEQNKQKNNLINTFSEQELELLEKQKQIQELLENILDDELKKLLKELQELMNNIDKNKLQDITQQFQLKTEEIAKELDRTLELLKKLDIEERMKSLTQNLNELAKQQEILSEQSLDKKLPLDTLINKQSKHEEQFKQLREEYQNIMKQNNELSNPFLMNSFQEEQKSIEQQMNESLEQLQQGDRKDASKKQKSTSSKLKELSQKMQQMMQQNIQQQQAEDEESLKKLLENIKNLSFEQEELMIATKNTKVNDPTFQKIVQKQSFIKDNIKIINDSLNALAKRNPIISSTIKKRLNNIKLYSNQIVKLLSDRNSNQAAIKQQLLMTEANELALLLGQIIEQMQESNSEQMCQGGQCKKKSKGSPKPGYQQLKQMQQQIKQQLQSILNEMKSQQGQKESKRLSEQLGKMISMQDKMQQMINEMLQQASGISPESVKKLQEIKRLMDDVQRDIANKNITSQTLMRQEQILTRLLEAEKSDNERETENKRESQTPKNEKFSNPKEIFQYKSKKSMYEEILYNSNLPLQKFYQELYRKYMINLNQQ